MPILKIKDENGNFVSVPAITGADGKSAYEQALDGGYNGTEEEFIDLLNGLTYAENIGRYSTDLNNELQQGGYATTICRYDNSTLNTPTLTPYTHRMAITNTSGEYAVQLCIPTGEGRLYIRTLNQAGISEWIVIYNQIEVDENMSILSQVAENSYVKKSGDTITGDVSLYNSYHPALRVGVDGSNTTHIFYTQNKTVDIYNWTNGEPTTLSLGNVNSMLLRDIFKLWVGAKDYQIYGDHNASELGISKVATGTYVGTGTGGAGNPSLLTLPFTPKVVFISLEGQENRCEATLPLVYGSRIGLVFSSTSSNWSTHSAFPLNLVWENNTLYFTYTLNATSVDQRQLNISGLTYRWIIYG